MCTYHQLILGLHSNFIFYFNSVLNLDRNDGVFIKYQLFTNNRCAVHLEIKLLRVACIIIIQKKYI